MGSDSITNQFRGSQVHEPTPDSPYHKRRREDMRTRIKQYGFFQVTKEPVIATQCSGCQRNLIASVDWIKINGRPICGDCLKKDARN